MTENKENKATSAKDQKKSEQKKIAPAKKEENKKPEEKNKADSGNKFVWLVIVILIVAIAAAGVFVSNRINKLEKEFIQSNSDNSAVEKNINNKVDNKLKRVLSELETTQQKIDEIESKQEVLSHSLSQPAEQQVHVNEDYAFAEIEHLLTIANYNLQLDHNVATALSAMQAVDTRLKAFNDAAAISAREQLIADMNELRSLNQADLSGMALYLSDLISRVDELQLKENVVIEQEFETEQAQETEEPVEGIKHFFVLVWEELKSLVVITRDNEVAAARLLPDEVYFLRANLKLELANARFAVFNRDTDNLHTSIKHMQTWLHSYFDIADANVRNIYDTLTAMKKTELEFPKLNISSSLESVRALSRMKKDSIDNDVQLENIEDNDDATEVTVE